MTDHTQDVEKPNGAAYGKALKSFGVNLLVRDVLAAVRFQVEVLGAEQVYSDTDFAIMRHQGSEWMLHGDHTYHDNPLLGLTGDGAMRGVGCELRLYGVDPDQAAERARARGDAVLAEAADKPHGLRECYLIDSDGYVWVPGVARTD